MPELPFTGPALVFFTLTASVLLAPLLAERLRLPGVIGLVLAGLLIGPEGLGLLERSGIVEQLGGFGLLYLMFLAGIELDVAASRANRRRATIFGLLTFAIPMILGTSSALLLGFGGLASVLIGSLWASHTLVAYPLIRRSGIVADASVAATVGATVITDTLALIVLAVVASSYTTNGGFGFLGLLIPGLALLVVVVMWLLPLVARWFFAGMGQDRTLRFMFVLVGFLGAAVLADAVGVEGIVGAFLAGLALNRLVPNGGVLMQRVEFAGSAIFIPIFLISVGMLVDIKVVIDVDTLGLAAAFVAVATGAKWIAAELAGRLFGFERSQIGVMFALSNAQAAATLAATVVGFELGLFDDRVVNAVLIVILVTVWIASWTAARSAPKVTVPEIPADRLGRMVLAPVAHPDTASDLVRLGSWIAGADGGQLLPLHVVTSPDASRVREAAPLMAQIEASLARLGGDVDSLIRVDQSVASGVVNTAVERDASLVLLGWKGATTTRDRFFGSLLDDVIDRAPCAVAACWLPGSDFSRLLLMAQKITLAEAPTILGLCRRLARAGDLPVTVMGDHSTIEAEPGWALQAVDADMNELGGNLRPGDLVLVPGGRGRTSLHAIALELMDANPSVGFIAVHPPKPTDGVTVTELFAGG